MGTIFNIVGCECSKDNNKKLKLNNSYNPVLVSDFSSSEMICSTIIPREIYKDQPKRSYSVTKNKYYINRKKDKVFEKYNKVCILGKNNYNIVYKVQNLKHDNLMKLYEFYEDEKYFYLITDLCEETFLDKILEEHEVLCEFIVKYIMYRIFLALNYLHKQNIIHGDIKITNIGFIPKERTKEKNEKLIPIRDLINEICNDINLDIKLLDCWSQEIFIKNIIDFENSDILLNINYYSPELFDGCIIKERDEWACGILMYKLFKGNYPFDGENKDELIQDIIKGNISEEINELKISNDCKNLMKTLLEKNPKNRIKVEECLKLGYFKKGVKFKKSQEYNK